MRGSQLQADTVLARVAAGRLDTLIIPGGNSTAMLQTDPRVLTLLMEMQHEEKPVGAIGSGSAALASAGMVAGRRVTGDMRVRTALEENGAIFLEQGVVVDHNMVTAQSESHLDHFIDAIAFLLEPAPSLR
jgi:protease I